MIQTLMLILSSPVEITETNFDETVVQSGKMSFVKFYAPWCGHCKKMKPVWDQLSDLYEDSKDVIIGDIDCTAPSSKKLCEKFSIQGFPTLKLLNSDQAENYEGERDLNAFKLFIENKILLNSCSVKNQTNCPNDIKQVFKKYKKLSKEELHAKKQELNEKMNLDKSKLEFLLETLQSTYEKAMNNTKVSENESNQEILGINKLLSSSNKDEL